MGIKDILKKGRESAKLIEATTPLRGRVDVESLAHSDEDKQRLENTEIQIAMLEQLNKYTRAQDVFSDFSARAAKQIAIETVTGKTSGDRRKAAEAVLSWELGKPLARSANLNLSSTTDLSENELNAEIGNLLSALGFTQETVQTKLLLDDKDSKVTEILEGKTIEHRTDADPRLDDDPKPDVGPRSESEEGTTSEAVEIDEGCEERAEIERLCAESGLPREFF